MTSVYLAERKRIVFWRTMIVVALLDFATKEWARHQLVPEHMPRPLFGDIFRLTLVYNPGAAFGLHVGEHSRWVFMTLTIVAIFVLTRLYGTTRAGDGSRVFALGLVMGGAGGNLINRIWSSLLFLMVAVFIGGVCFRLLPRARSMRSGACSLRWRHPYRRRESSA